MAGISMSHGRFDNVRAVRIVASHLYIGKPGLEMPTEMPFDGFELFGRPLGYPEVQIDIHCEAIDLGSIPIPGLRGQSGRIKLDLQHKRPIIAGPASLVLYDDEDNLWFFTPNCGIAGVWWSGESLKKEVHPCEIELYPFWIEGKEYLLTWWPRRRQQ